MGDTREQTDLPIPDKKHGRQSRPLSGRFYPPSPTANLHFGQARISRVLNYGRREPWRLWRINWFGVAAYLVALVHAVFGLAFLAMRNGSRSGIGSGNIINVDIILESLTFVVLLYASFILTPIIIFLVMSSFSYPRNGSASVVRSLILLIPLFVTIALDLIVLMILMTLHR